jgi:type IV pilus assembly protein PilN
MVKTMQVSATKDDITSANKKINELKTKIGKLEELKTLKEQVKKKLDVLSQLRKNKTGPAQRLASLSDLAPDKLWLTNYVESGQDVKVSGIAFTEELIAQFMKALEASKDFMAVELVVSEQTEVAGTKLKKFDLTMKLESVATQPLVAPAVK